MDTFALPIPHKTRVKLAEQSQPRTPKNCGYEQQKQQALEYDIYLVPTPLASCNLGP